MSEKSEEIIGIYVSAEEYFGPLNFEKRMIPKETLVEMTRQNLVPILTMEEVERRGRSFLLVSNFAAKYNGPSRAE